MEDHVIASIVKVHGIEKVYYLGVFHKEGFADTSNTQVVKMTWVKDRKLAEYFNRKTAKEVFKYVIDCIKKPYVVNMGVCQMSMPIDRRTTMFYSGKAQCL